MNTDSQPSAHRVFRSPPHTAYGRRPEMKSTRLIDDLRAGFSPLRPRVVAPSFQIKWLEHAAQIHNLLRDPGLFIAEINGVATYYFETNDQEFWDLGRSS